jgi:hypothetical protein
VENLQLTGVTYSEKLFISRTVVFLMDRLWPSVSGIEDYYHFTDRYYSNVELAQELDNWICKYTFVFLILCPCCTNFSGKTVHLVAQQAFKNSWRLDCRNFSKRDDRRGLITSWNKRTMNFQLGRCHGIWSFV